jgi:mono/diheme cytochrome c family protein
MRKAPRLAPAGVALAILTAGLAYALSHGLAGPLEGTRLDPQNFVQIEQGRYLVYAADCQSCHNDPATNTPFTGGRPIVTPFGTVVAANITPDRETGIGAWSDAEFVTALREGKTPNGSLLYPAMPYPYYTKLTEADAIAIRAYLNTVKPVRNAVVTNRLPFPFNIREAMAVWNALYFEPGDYLPDASKSPEWNRGAYLVLGAGHCGACHTAKTTLGGDDSAHALQGSELQGWFAPNITGDTVNGIGGWSVPDVVAYLKSGHNATTSATGIMGEEITFASSHMADDDLAAIATYLKSLPGQTQAAPAIAGSDPRMTAGAAIYVDECSACHAGDGKGVPYLFPALAGSANVHSANPTSLIRVLLEGARSVATSKEPTGPGMPSFSWKLDDQQAAAVLTYVRNSWGSSAPAVSADQVRAVRASLASSANR